MRPLVAGPSRYCNKGSDYKRKVVVHVDQECGCAKFDVRFYSQRDHVPVMGLILSLAAPLFPGNKQETKPAFLLAFP